MVCVILFVLLKREPDRGWYRRREALAIGAVLGAATVSIGGWQVVYGSSFGFGPSGLGVAARDVFGQSRLLVDQSVGVFGWLDTRLPTVVYLAWLAVIAGLVVGALIVGSWRSRASMVLLALGVMAAAIAIQGFVLGPARLSGQLIQARYVMPCALLLPLVAGEILTRRYRGSYALIPRVAVPLFSVAHVFALYTYARRNAVGRAGSRLLTGATWSPPGGWLPWAALAVVSLIAVGACALLDRRPLSPTALA